MAEGNIPEHSGFDKVDMSDPKAGLPSPPLGMFSFSRTSSTGSIDMLTSSSAQNTDDEDSDHKSTFCYKERRREAHTQAEQKRRDAIKKGYDDLQYLVPTCSTNDVVGGYKVSKAIVLQKTIDYIQFLLQQQRKQDDELQALRKEVVGLQIMKSNYEQMISAQQSQPDTSSNRISEDIKFQLFQAICESLFHSFNNSVSVNNFSEISASIFSWLEEYCKPPAVKEVIVSLLFQLSNANLQYR